MRKNNKGFTLVELLVAIVIMGIITALALPEVQQLQSKNREKKYEKYEESTVSSAKLYVDSYEEDLFGTATTGCKDLDYDMLSSKNLLKDYETNDVTCKGTDTFVHIEKKDGKYVYQPYITCRKKDGTIVYQTSPSVSRCGATDEFNSVISGSISINDATSWTKTKTATITFSTTAEGGMIENSFGNYCIVDSSNVCIEGTTKKVTFEKTGAKTITSPELTIDNPSLSGSFKLRFNPSGVQDNNGITYTSDLYSDNFNLDNTAPVITEVSETTYTWVYKKLLDFDFDVLRIKFNNNNPAGSDVASIVYSLDSNVVDKSVQCKVADELDKSWLLTFFISVFTESNSFSELLKNRGFELCTIDNVNNQFYISKDQMGDADKVYIKITDEAGNSSVYEYKMGSNIAGSDIIEKE